MGTLKDRHTETLFRYPYRTCILNENKDKMAMRPWFIHLNSGSRGDEHVLTLAAMFFIKTDFLFNFEREHYGYPLCEFILNLPQWLRRSWPSQLFYF